MRSIVITAFAAIGIVAASIEAAPYQIVSLGTLGGASRSFKEAIPEPAMLSLLAGTRILAIGRCTGQQIINVT